jgi:hypothetical protein
VRFAALLVFDFLQDEGAQASRSMKKARGSLSIPKANGFRTEVNRGVFRRLLCSRHLVEFVQTYGGRSFRVSMH